MSSSIAALAELPLRGQNFTPRYGLSAACMQGKVYIFGGYLWFHGVEGFFNDLYELDLGTSAIRRICPDGCAIPPPRFGHTLVADATRLQLVLFGGRNARESFNDVWTFDIVKNQWTQLSSVPNSARTGDGVKSRSGSPVSSSPTLSTSQLAGAPGAAFNEESNSVARRSESKKTSKRSDRASGSSKTLHTEGVSPQCRSWHTATLFRSSVYIYGGWDQYNHPFNDLWCLDLATYQWSCINPPDAMAKPPHGRSCHQAACWGDSMYIFGGLRDGDAVIADMWRFSFEAKIWSPVECNGPRPSGRTSCAGCVVGDSWVIHGGLTDYPRAGISAISDVLEFNFLTNTWTPRAVVLSDGVSSSARRYGHVAIAHPFGATSLSLLGGSEKYATACQSLTCRIDLIPSQAQVTEIQQDLCTTGRMAQINRDRIGELMEAVQSYETQLRLVKTEVAALNERCQTLQTQTAALHQQQSALQSSLQTVQQALASIEQFIPMMRNVGAAIANFGSNAAGAVWSSPGSSASLSRSAPLQSSNELR